MKVCPKPFILLIATIFLPLLFSGQARALDADRIAAIVNSEPVLLSELQERMDPSQKETPSLLWAVLNQIIDQKIQIQQARKKGITVSDNELRQAIEETRVKNGLTGEEAFKKSLEKENLTLEKVSAEIKNQLLIRKLVQREVFPEITLREEEIKNYYEQHPEQFRIAEKRRVFQILLEFKVEDGPAEKEKIRNLANFLFAGLKEGKSLEQLARENSEPPGSFRAEDLGSFGKRELLPAIDEVVFSLEPEKWSRPVETESGLHLLKIEKSSSSRKPYEEVKKEIQDQMFQEKSELALAEWIANLRKGATIEIPLFKEEMPKNRRAP